MGRYTASSVMHAIEQSSYLNFDSAAAMCPRKDSAECKVIYQKCEWGQEKKCWQKVSVFDIKKCLRHLYLNFTVSVTNYDGVIDEHDAQLVSLIQKGYINKSKLTRC
jgi:hypothetical protein